jgi:hypothetical protein
VPVHDAFTVLRSSARSRNRRLSELAQAIVDGSEQFPAVHIPAERQPSSPTRQPGRHHETEASEQ